MQQHHCCARMTRQPASFSRAAHDSSGDPHLSEQQLQLLSFSALHLRSVRAQLIRRCDFRWL